MGSFCEGSSLSAAGQVQKGHTTCVLQVWGATEWVILLDSNCGHAVDFRIEKSCVHFSPSPPWLPVSVLCLILHLTGLEILLIRTDSSGAENEMYRE